MAEMVDETMRAGREEGARGGPGDGQVHYVDALRAKRPRLAVLAGDCDPVIPPRHSAATAAAAGGEFRCFGDGPNTTRDGRGGDHARAPPRADDRDGRANDDVPSETSAPVATRAIRTRRFGRCCPTEGNISATTTSCAVVAPRNWCSPSSPSLSSARDSSRGSEDEGTEPRVADLGRASRRQRRRVPATRDFLANVVAKGAPSWLDQSYPLVVLLHRAASSRKVASP